MVAVTPRDKRHSHLRNAPWSSAWLQASTHMEYSLILNFQQDADAENILYLQRYATVFIILYCISQVLPTGFFLLWHCQGTLGAVRNGQIQSFLLYPQTQPPSHTLPAPSQLYRPGHLTQPGQVMLNCLMVTLEPNKEHGRREKWRTHWHFSEISVLQCYLNYWNYKGWMTGSFCSTCVFLIWNVRMYAVLVLSFIFKINLHSSEPISHQHASRMVHPRVVSAPVLHLQNKENLIQIQSRQS